MTPLNPRTKFTIKEAIERFLYDPFNAYFTKQLTKLIVKNCKAQRRPHLSFVYKEEHYSVDAPPLPRPRNQLLAEFRPTMEELLAERRLVADEQPQVMAYAVQVLNASNAPGDWLKLFPDSTHYAFKKAVADAGIELNWLDCQLPETEIEALKTKHQKLFDLMRQRMTINILIS